VVLLFLVVGYTEVVWFCFTSSGDIAYVSFLLPLFVLLCSFVRSVVFELILALAVRRFVTGIAVSANRILHWHIDLLGLV